MNEIPYIGNELELFENAKNWKSYFGKELSKYIGKYVLEIGAGFGGTTSSLCDGSQEKWLCLEPDPELYRNLKSRIDNHRLPSCCSALQGTLETLPKNELYDTILYIDVLEHIEKDADELRYAMEYLKPGGYLIVLVPAEQKLYSPFDKAIGHFRRYDKAMLSGAAPTELKRIKLFYLDSLGFFASVVNKFFLKQSYPTLKQVLFWDRMLIPVSKITDWIIGYSRGKSLIGIWSKKN